MILPVTRILWYNYGFRHKYCVDRVCDESDVCGMYWEENIGAGIMSGEVIT